MQDRLINYSEDVNLNDRDPAFDFSDTTTVESLHKSSEDYKSMMETINTLSRKKRRKIIKPSFSNNVRATFKK